MTLNKNYFLAVFMGALSLNFSTAADKGSDAGKGGPAARDGMRDVEDAHQHPLKKSKEKNKAGKKIPAPAKPISPAPSPTLNQTNPQSPQPTTPGAVQ